MKDKVTIGIDIGTSGCKVLALRADGSIAASATEGYPLYQPQPGWTEQEPTDWWEAAAKGSRRVMSDIGDAEVAGVSFSGQMHGMVALDRELRVIRRAPLWNDQRTQSQCDEITEAAGGLEGLLGFTNNMMLTGYTGGKVLWLREKEPENFERTYKIVNPKDYVRLMMTGELCTEVSDASGVGLFDVGRRCWSEPLLERIGLSKALFGDVLESVDLAGRVTAEAAELTGIPEGTSVFAGGGDAVLSVLGLGITAPGTIGVTLGTSGVVAAAPDRYAPNPGGMLQFFCGNAPGRWMAFGTTLFAAGSYQWFHDTIGAGKSFRELDAMAAEVEPGCGGLVFLPYLNGERCPIFDPNARGVFAGIHSTMGLGHFARAVLEGVCFSQKQVFDAISSAMPSMVCDSVSVAGGGAKSPLWRQMLADIFGCPVHTVFGSAEGGSFGAALVARVGSGLSSSLDEATELVKAETEILPDPANAEVYSERYARYISVWPPYSC